MSVPKTHLVQDAVADSNQRHDFLTFQHLQHVVGHALPKVDKEILHLLA